MAQSPTGGGAAVVVVVPILMCSFVFLSLSLSPPLTLPWENGPGAEKQSRPAWGEVFTSSPSWPLLAPPHRDIINMQSLSLPPPSSVCRSGLVGREEDTTPQRPFYLYSPGWARNDLQRLV